MKTGWAAVKLAIAGFVVPYMFVFSPELLLINTAALDGIRVCIGACMGVLLIAVAVEGYFMTKVFVPLRIIALGGAFLLIDSRPITDIIGLAIFIGVIVIQWLLSKKRA
jgi:TRAP-type uncharacterized transport system fused permease subunit